MVFDLIVGRPIPGFPTRLICDPYPFLASSACILFLAQAKAAGPCISLVSSLSVLAFWQLSRISLQFVSGFDCLAFGLDLNVLRAGLVCQKGTQKNQITPWQKSSRRFVLAPANPMGAGWSFQITFHA